MSDNLGTKHGYALCALNGLAIDLAMSGDRARARETFDEALRISKESRGPRHPYTLACAVNAAVAASSDGAEGAGATVLGQAVAGLADALGDEHPEVIAARAGTWAECDIEPPPT
jgi:hypothetical protein